MAVLRVGERIGPYRLLGTLGSGAMGEVWRARDERLDRLVAIKHLPAEVHSSAQREQLLREAKAAAAVPHPNVATVYDILSTDDRDYLVMELVRGESLAQLLERDGALTCERALEITIDVCAALDSAHKREILHRDIKPANIMLTSAGKVKVLDFGIAKLRPQDSEIAAAASHSQMRAEDVLGATLDSQGGKASGVSDTFQAVASPSLGTVAGRYIGTPLYMSPEQSLGERPDVRSEVYTVGVVAYELLCGHTPFEAPTLEDLFRKIALSTAPDLGDGVPSKLRQVIGRAMTSDPDGRFQSMAELHVALVAVRDQLFRRGRPAWQWLLLATGAVAVAAAIAFFVAKPSEVVERPGDRLVRRALDEYNLFDSKRASSSLRSALKNDPDHPKAHAYLLLFDTLDEERRRSALTEAQRVLLNLSKDSPDRALLVASIELATHGPAKARSTVLEHAKRDREMAFWRAEFAYRSGAYAAAEEEYAALLEAPSPTFRGRIYDHYSAVLLYADKTAKAEEVGKLYAEILKGEPDAIGVYATTLMAAGKHDEALVMAKEAVNLNEGEDTLAGLAKVHAYRGEFVEARVLYRKALRLARPERRVIRRAALALLLLMDGMREEAIGVVTPCLEGGEDSDLRQRGMCLFVAGLAVPEQATVLATELEAMAGEASALRTTYGEPDSLAKLLRARARFFGGGCILPEEKHEGTAPDLSELLNPSLDFYANYHLPFFAWYQHCERAANLHARGKTSDAIELLSAVADRAKGRSLVHYKLHRLHLEAGHSEEARLELRQARSWLTLDDESQWAAQLAAD